MAEETYPPKIYRNKGHGRISELKVEAIKKERRKKLTVSKLVGGAENTAHPRVAAPELRPEFELVNTDLPKTPLECFVVLSVASLSISCLFFSSCPTFCIVPL